MLTSSQVGALLNRSRHYVIDIARGGAFPYSMDKNGHALYQESDIFEYIMKTFHTSQPDDWASWFSGLVDGEGHFAITQLRNRTTFLPQFSIGLRVEEEPIIRDIHARLGCGNVYVTPRTYTNRHGDRIARKVEFYAHNLDSCRKIDDLLQSHPLRTNKSQDYEIWHEFVQIKRIPRSQRDAQIQERMEFLFREIRRVRIDRKID